MTTPGPGKPRQLTRERGDGLIAGVAAGLGEHLGVPPWVIRTVFVLTAPVSGLGILLYVAYWAVVAPSEGTHLWRRPAVEIGQLVAFGALGAAALVVLAAIGVTGRLSLALPLVIVGVGVALVWRQASGDRRDTGGPAGSVYDSSRIAAWGGWIGLLRVGAGVVLVIGGVITYLALSGAPLTKSGVAAVVAILSGVALVSGPWWWRVYSDLREERRARIRSEERADIAAHVHDSVLHTLALIQRHSDSPREVARLARGQERDLRRWLYESESDPHATFAAALREAAAEVEDGYAINVEVVIVGDLLLAEDIQAMVRAAREALVNAARHSGVEAVSLYAEVEGDRVSVFVRDRGRGFDPGHVDPDRHGIAGSIRDRMARHGGCATIISAPGEGAEVRLELSHSPVQDAPPPRHDERSPQ